jgi:hypothetical protein
VVPSTVEDVTPLDKMARIAAMRAVLSAIDVLIGFFAYDKKPFGKEIVRPVGAAFMRAEIVFPD